MTKVKAAVRRVGWVDTVVMFGGYSRIVLAFANQIDTDEAQQVALGACIAGFLKFVQIWANIHKESA